MAIADLSNVLNIFGGSEIDESAQQQLFKETLLMTLARAADCSDGSSFESSERL